MSDVDDRKVRAFLFQFNYMQKPWTDASADSAGGSNTFSAHPWKVASPTTLITPRAVAVEAEQPAPSPTPRRRTSQIG